MEPRRRAALRAACARHRTQQCRRWTEFAQGQVRRYPGRHAARAKHLLSRKQNSLAPDGGRLILVDAGSPQDNPSILWRQNLQRISPALQTHDSCDRLEHHSTRGQLHGLGEASPKESRRKTPYASGLAIVPAQIRHRGHGKEAIQWQVWTALLVYVLLRFLAHVSDWPHSFTRLFGLIRCSIWTRLDLLRTLRAYGTAGGDFRMLAAPEQAYLPGFARH